MDTNDSRYDLITVTVEKRRITSRFVVLVMTDCRGVSFLYFFAGFSVVKHFDFWNMSELVLSSDVKVAG